MGKDYLSMRIHVDQAAKIAYRLYRVSGEVNSLPGEIDFNYGIKSDSGSYILKISRPHADVDFIEFQQGILDHLAKSSTRLDSPVVFPDLHGNFNEHERERQQCAENKAADGFFKRQRR
jgi:Ser/Thr protein kinase RdoA (MazF antagonist)